jgi:hypothetical protein
MRTKKAATVEVKLYLGSKEGYHGREFDQAEVMEKIGSFQKQVEQDRRVSVRITPTTYLVGDYTEKGWEIVAINYPRFPSNPTDFMKNMAAYLLSALKQNRISVVTSSETFLFESDNAQQNP